MKKHLTHRLRRMTALLLCLALLPACFSAEAASAKTIHVSFSVTIYQNRARDLLKQLNTYRKQNGLPQLTMTADLESAAIQRAAELFVFFDHSRPDLTDFDTVTADYSSLKNSLAVAECIAAGYTKAAETMADWQQNAAEHLNDPDFTHVGIACVYVKGSYNEYYWVMLLEQQPDDFKGKAAAETAKAGKTKSMKVEIASGMYERADNSHKRFELRAGDLNLKTKQTAQPTVYLYDRYDVKIGKVDLEDLSYKSSNTAIFTVTADGVVRRKKAGTGTLTISATGLTAVKCAVTIGSGTSGTSNSSNSVAVTAATIGERKPTLSLSETTKQSTLSVYVRGASGYVLYRSATKSGTYTKVAEKASTKRWDYRMDKDDMTKTYYYKVRAYKNSNGRKVYSEYSTAVKVAP